ncbi:hypothetical protein RclHR1_17690003 [Rhizophagus clarus]|uniref:Uncharacterized protein n=1 Tax=Rhizophagus clarus TaxID=94130 RepID=A0A2Z6QXZ2_9GLOM|nr:hypothetical protein RclHR1_17690003 [Rhizophagus clarus]GES96152.1 hypothetical protein GLOIN_2v1491448 [Rhizophagus clarus]
MNNLIPEILKDIFKYVYDPDADSCYIADRNHLYSCLLVNRHWCKIAVPILWNRALNYYGSTHERQTKILSLLKCLDQKSRNNLINNGVPFPFISDEVAIFQYTSYIEVLDYGKLINLVEDWLNTLQKLPAESLCLILRAILKLLVKETKIKSFKNWPLKYSTDLFHLILVEKNIENLFLNVRDLLIITNIRLDRFLGTLIKICRNIKKLSIRIPGQTISTNSHYVLESTQMSLLIQHQQTLQKLKIFEGLGSSIIINETLSSVKNSLTKLIFKYVNFEGCDSWYGIRTLHMLEVFKCKNCIGLTVEMIKPLIECTREDFKKIKKVDVDWNTCKEANILLDEWKLIII